MSGEVKKFSNNYELVVWLINQGVGEDDAAEAAATLLPTGFNEPDALWGITSQQLENSGLATPLAMKLSNKLKDRQVGQVS